MSDCGRIDRKRKRSGPFCCPHARHKGIPSLQQLLLLVVVAAVRGGSVRAARAPVDDSGLTPWSAPLRGFNSWQAFRYWVTEAQVLGVAAAMADRGFVRRGFRYVVIDEGWSTNSNNTNTSHFDPAGAAIDGFGRWLPSPDRFPSGLKALCARLAEERGVLCGVHLIGGVPIIAADRRLPIKGAAGYTAADIANASAPNGVPPMTFNPKIDSDGALVAGAEAYFASVVDLLVQEWGVRFIKW